MAYIGLDINKLASLDEQYAQTLVDYFSPLIPEGYSLRTQHEQGEVIVHKQGFQAEIKIAGDRLVFSKHDDRVINNMLLTLCARIFEYKSQLTQYKMVIAGLKG